MTVPAAPVSSAVEHKKEAGSDPRKELHALRKNWQAIVDEAGKIALTARSVIVDAHPVKVEGGKVTIAFEPDFASHKEQCGNVRVRKAVEHAVGMILKREIEIDCVIGKKLEEDYIEEESAPDEPAPKKGKPDKFDLMKNKDVQRILEAFDGNIVEVRE